MDQHLIFLLLGLANGAVYAALALTLVVTYRSSGVVNFATGTMALLGAYTYAFLRQGEVLVPLPFLPEAIELPVVLHFWPAALIGVAVCAATGLLLHVSVFRPVRSAPPVAKAVASIGLMLVLTAVFQIRVGPTGVRTGPILPSGTWTLGDVRITQDRVYFAITILAITLLLAAAYRFTRFGLLTRAVAESEKGSFVSGIVPDRVAAANSMISAAIAGVSGILISPIVPPTPFGYTFFIVPALAAAVLGQFQYIVTAVVGGLAIGMLQSEMTYLRGQHQWLPSAGLAELVPLVLILVVLVVRAKPLPSRGVVLLQSLGRAPRPQSVGRTAAFGAVAGAVSMFLLSGEWRSALITSMILAIVSLSLVVVTGYAGQISLAQMALAGVAGFILGPLTTDLDIPFPIAPLLAALGATVVGVVILLPALRIRGLSVAVVTLSMGVAIEAVWFRNSEYVGTSGQDVEGPSLFGVDLRAQVGTDFPRVEFGLMVLVVLVGVAVGVAALRRSRLGSEMLAVRANERSAAGAGIDVVRVKLIAFVIGSFIAGLGGSLIAYFQGNVTFDAFTVFVGLGLFATAYIGGVTSVSGGLVAGFLAAGGLNVKAFDLLPLPDFGRWYAVVSGIGLILTIVLNPEGVVGPFHAKRAARRAGDSAVGPVRATTDEVRLEPMAPVAGGEVVLSAKGMRVAYGGVVAVDGVDLDAAQGTIVGLIGPNGAGKTTLLDAISGFTPCSGTVTLEGRELGGQSPHRRVRAGLGRTFQQTQLYEDLSVTENVVVGIAGARSPRPTRGRRDARAARPRRRRRSTRR